MARLNRGDRKKTIISVAIKDRESLHDCYMPFVQNGGLFITGRTEYDLGDEVFILLDLMNETDKIPVAGKVAWVAREGVKHPHKPGMGVAFNDPDNLAKIKIENLLVGMPEAATATM